MRELTQEESDLLAWVLPDDRPGYKVIHDLVRRRNVVAQGRRGDGHLILAEPGTVVDHDSPLPQVFAFGEVEYEDGECVITVREPLGDQIDVEITGVRTGRMQRRWTFSEWSPGGSCPKCGGPVRLVVGQTASGHSLHLAICATDKRIWVSDSRTGVNHPIPMTLFYSELMRRTGTKDPAIALDTSRLFTHTGSYRDEDLLGAFASYNDIRAKVSVEDRIVVPERRRGLLARLSILFGKRP